MKAARQHGGFTLVELLLVISIIGILAALLFPVLSKAKTNAQRTTCLNNLKQIDLAVLLYAGDNRDILPVASNLNLVAGNGSNCFAYFYKSLVMNYVGMQGAPSPQDKIFTCPADTFFYDDGSLTYVNAGACSQWWSDYSSYAYDGLNAATNTPITLPGQTSSPGISGWKLSSIMEHDRTVLVAEDAALNPWSWHEPQALPSGQVSFNNSKNMVGYADGHVSYTQIYWNSNYNLESLFYNPSNGYDYKWSGD